MKMKIQERELMHLALAYDQNKTAAENKLNAFLEENGVSDTKRFFLEWTVTQRGQTQTTYLEFATVPESVSGKGDINVSKVKEGHDLIISFNKEEYDDFLLGESNPEKNQEIKAFLKEKGYRRDNVFLFPFIEMDGDEYIVHTPVR